MIYNIKILRNKKTNEASFQNGACREAGLAALVGLDFHLGWSCPLLVYGDVDDDNDSGDDGGPVSPLKTYPL